MAKVKPDGYKEKVTDEQLVHMVEQGVLQSVGDWLNSSDLTRERLRATYEYAGLPVVGSGLEPNGVSQIVDSSTTEVVEAYTAILAELILSNNKIARFVPYRDSVTARNSAKMASDMVNYCVFKKNNGWQLLTQWIKSALLWKNSVIRWDYIEDFEYVFHEYETISQIKLDEMLADPAMEIVGELEVDTEIVPDEETGESIAQMVYKNVRLRETIDKSRVEMDLIPPENFRITRDATCIEDASFIGVIHEVSRSDIRKMFPDVADKIEDWGELGDLEWNTKYTEEMAARKHITGQEYWQGSNMQDIYPTEANRTIVITECWLRADRDGDGIAELKHLWISGNHILREEDVDSVNLASLCPIDIPHEFYGLSIADFTRSSTLASTAILRGLIENTYLTNFSPKLADPNLADPNVVDFSALQNMKPKQLIATNGNPQAAVAPLPPETLAPSTVPALEYLQLHKEQATGMSKAAQGLNDTLYVSGNSEQKVQSVQNASQKRIQHIARTFTETGFKRLITGIYKTIKLNMDKFEGMGEYNEYLSINIASLPEQMEVEVMADVGDHANSTMMTKLGVVQQLMDGLQSAGAGLAIKQEAPMKIAEMTFNALDLNPADFIEDWEDPEFIEAVAQSKEQEQQAQQAQQALEQRNLEADARQKEMNVVFTRAQAENTKQDNVRQTAISLDKHFQEWEKLNQDAIKEGSTPPQKPDIQEMFATAQQVVEQMKQADEPQDPLEKLMKLLQDNPDLIQQVMGMLQGGPPQQ